MFVDGGVKSDLDILGAWRGSASLSRNLLQSRTALCECVCRSPDHAVKSANPII